MVRLTPDIYLKRVCQDVDLVPSLREEIRILRVALNVAISSKTVTCEDEQSRGYDVSVVPTDTDSLSLYTEG